MSDNRFIIGIDLGTTNCAVAYWDLWDKSQDVTSNILKITQWENQSATVKSTTLPSFIYLPPKAMWKKGQLALPFHKEVPSRVVGRYARMAMNENPGRVIQSAKSWLSHGNINRGEPVLPWHSDEIVGSERLSPVEASAEFLSHIKFAWDQEMAETNDASRFDQQKIVITVPASFDEVAQSLTLEAAKMAGYPMSSVSLLEEPQAAFYHWLNSNDYRRTENEATEEGFRVVICDIGGGTTDFSLFSWASNDAAEATFERVSVSPHILLGGDNMDLAIAHLLESKVVSGNASLDSSQWANLVGTSRCLKEKAFALVEQGQGETMLRASLAKSGSSLFAGTTTVEVSADEIVALLLDGFFPVVEKDDEPESNDSAILELGLPYASDSGITRHLATFLNERPVDAVLFTGGTMKPESLQQRIHQVLSSWQSRPVSLLPNDAMDLACAHGAAIRGAHRQLGIAKISGGYARNLYLEVADKDGRHNLISIMERGSPEGTVFTNKETTLEARLGEHVRFQLFASLTRTDEAGSVVAFGEEGVFPASSVTALLDKPGEKPGKNQSVRVSVQAEVRETGVLELKVSEIESGYTWNLNFNLRSSGDSIASEAPESVSIEQGEAVGKLLKVANPVIRGLYGKARKGASGNPKGLVRDLEGILSQDRSEWDAELLRGLWPEVCNGMTRKGRSPGHESSWLYIAGYSLRPGYGAPLDEWRVSQLWRGFNLGLTHGGERQIQEQWWIMWRRVAGGLGREEQEILFDKIFPAIKKDDAGPEVIMLAGSLERVSVDKKLRLGHHLVQNLVSGKKSHVDRKAWALTRIASRIPLYGGPETIVRPKVVMEWQGQLMKLGVQGKHYQNLEQFFLNSSRKVNDREFDIPPAWQEKIVDFLTQQGVEATKLRPLTEYVPYDAQETAFMFGESLPVGLVMGGRS